MLHCGPPGLRENYHDRASLVIDTLGGFQEAALPPHPLAAADPGGPRCRRCIDPVPGASMLARL